MKNINRSFNALAEWTARNTGSPVTFIGALALVVVWGASGPLFDFSATWQLVINTGTTIATFLMVFLLQNSQNRTTAELQHNTEELKKMVRKMSMDNRRLLAKLESIEEDIEELVEDDLDEEAPKTL